MSSYFLSSARLRFRHWTEADLPLATALWADPDGTEYLDPPLTPEAVRARLALEMQLQSTVGVQYWPIFLLATAEHVGCAGLRPYREEPNVFELATHIKRSYWGMRLGEEAAGTVIAYAFDTLRTEALTTGHHPEHRRSKRLIDKFGFVFTHEEPRGAFHIQHPFYRLNRPSI